MPNEQLNKVSRAFSLLYICVIGRDHVIHTTNHVTSDATHLLSERGRAMTVT